VKKSLTFATGALLMTSIFSAAHADDTERWPRWYLGLSGGFTYMQDEDVSGGSATKLSLDNGFGVGGSIGYLPSSSIPLINSLRFEGEVTYHQNQINKATRSNGSTFASSGNYDSTAYMLNTFYDLPTGTNWSPYIGAGIGAATVHLDTGSGAGNTGGSDTQFAYQGLVGIGYSPDSIPNTQWTLGYRYLATTNPDFDTATGGDVKTKYSTNSVEIGGKFRF
jgi:opacity protein-like surface antigen